VPIPKPKGNHLCATIHGSECIIKCRKAYS
jgi:hypothetical protein